MRNPNKFGCVYKMSGNRRNPFRARVTTGWEYDEKTGRKTQKYATIGYYPTRKAAMLALAEYHKDPSIIDKNTITFEEIFTRWFAENSKNWSESNQKIYRSSFKQLPDLHARKIQELRKADLQNALNKISHMSGSAQSKARTVIKGVFTYCMENDLVEKDYSKFVKIDAPVTEEKHTSYTEEEIQALWEYVDTPVQVDIRGEGFKTFYPAKIILISIYTGMRPGEVLVIEKEKVYLKERYLIGGFKTTAGTDRRIPIHDDIYPFIEELYNEADKYLLTYQKGKVIPMQRFRMALFNPIIDQIGLEHLPHDGRHTFATFAERANVKAHIIKMIMGHKTGDLTKDVYTHTTTAELVEAVNQIKFKNS